LSQGSNSYPRRLRQIDPAAKQGDDELLALGKQLACAQPKLASLLRWFDCVQELVAEEVLRRGTWPEDTAEWTWRDAASYSAAREWVERETEIGAAYVQAMNAVEACHMRIDPICTAILALKARTREGRVVKKMARAIRTGHWRD
jgi:hypothetical protein